MDRLRMRVTRERVAFGLAAAVIVAGALVFFGPFLPLDARPDFAGNRFQIATSAIAVAVALGLRRWPGITAVVLIFAVEPVGSLIESAWWSSQGSAEAGAQAGANEPVFVLVFLAVIARMTVPAVILALYGTAPERRLARWVPPFAWFLVLLTVIGAALRYIAEVDVWLRPTEWWTWQQNAASSLDNPGLVWPIAVIALLGSLRAAGRRYVAPAVARLKTVGPSRVIGAAAGLAILLSIPAAFAFINRTHSVDTPGDGSERWIFVPVLLALVGIVASRWSRLAAWAAIAGAFQATAILVIYRGVAEYVAIVLALGPDADPPAPAIFVILTAAGVLIQGFAFGAFATAVLAVWREDVTRSEATRWAVVGALGGVLICCWYIVGGVLTSGLPFALEVLFLPAYPFLAVLLALGLWRRMVPAVAEAEAVATRPFQPIRYLETLVGETISGGAEHRRRAVETERARLASTLHAEFLPNLERLASENAAGATREEVTERLQELQDEVRRLMAERRLVVLEEFGIVEALEWLVAQAEERVSFEVELAVDDASTAERPPREVERAAFRVAQLAVENAIQHAGPSRLRLQVLARRDRLSIAIADDGHWVVPSTTDRRRDHVGIADMRSEADHVRGAVEVTPSQDGGTTVQFAWPAVAPGPARTTAPPAPAPGTAG